MTYALDAFIKDAKSALADIEGPAGREKVRVLLEKLLTNKSFVDEAVGPAAPIGTRKLYEDKDLGFVVLAHCNPKPHKSPPHDHGSSWAIYGQAWGETEMSDWEVLEAAAEGRPGKVRRGQVYTLKPGMAHIYHEGDVHSPKRTAATGLLRIEGKNTTKLKRYPYKAV